jgi:hypothetical protein
VGLIEVQLGGDGGNHAPRRPASRPGFRRCGTARCPLSSARQPCAPPSVSRKGWRRVDRQQALASTRVGLSAGLHEPSGTVHPAVVGHRALEHPIRQRRGCTAPCPRRCRPATHWATCFQPACCQSSNGPCLHGRSPNAWRSRRRARCRRSTSRCTAA